MAHRETGHRGAAALRTARRFGRTIVRWLDGGEAGHRSAPYPLTGDVPGYPIARNAARWRH